MMAAPPKRFPKKPVFSGVTTGASVPYPAFGPAEHGQHNLKQIGLAMHGQPDANKVFPRAYQDIDTKFDTFSYPSWTVLPHGCSRRKSLLIALKLTDPQMLRTTIPSRSCASGAQGK
jgi:hypothetical protein